MTGPRVVMEGLAHPIGARTLRTDRIEIAAGAFCTLTGPNGAGKTTLLRIVAGLLTPARGIVRTDGVVTLVHQQPYLFRGSTLANAAFGLRARGVPRAEAQERAREALTSVGLDALASRPARTLSGGEAQRVAVARAAVLAPDVLLLDEPAANLDPEGRTLLLALIGRLRDDRTTVVWAAPAHPDGVSADTKLHIDDGVVRTADGT